MAFMYNRRKPSLIRNFWIYRYLILAAVALGLMLWFVVINNTKISVVFPFGIARIDQINTGVVILLSALGGSLVTVMVTALLLTLRRLRKSESGADDAGPPPLPDERPPTDYGAKTPEGFPDSHWSSQ